MMITMLMTNKLNVVSFDAIYHFFIDVLLSKSHSVLLFFQAQCHKL